MHKPCPSIEAGLFDIAGVLTYIQQAAADMSSGQSYIVRLLREVETRLGRNGNSMVAARVGTIAQKMAQTDDVHEALETLRHVEGFGEFALRLMWALERAEPGTQGRDAAIMEYDSTRLGDALVTGEPDAHDCEPASKFSEKVDGLSLKQHEVGRLIEGIKRGALASGTFNGIEESEMCRLHGEMSILGEQAVLSGWKDLGRLAEACCVFIQYVVDHSAYRDIRVVNVLDNANLTLQTALDSPGVEDSDSLESTISLLEQPGELLNGQAP